MSGRWNPTGVARLIRDGTFPHPDDLTLRHPGTTKQVTKFHCRGDFS